VRLALVPSLLLISALVQADKIDDYVKGEMTRLHVPGMTVGIVKGGKLVSQRAYGVADLELNAPTTKDDVFQIGSITKQFTAFAAMILVEEGKIGLDDPVSKYIPEAPESWQKIKIRNLLYQNSGLKDYVFFPGIGLADEFDKAKWIDTMIKQPLDFEPGLAWAYSNSNYALMGWIIEKAAGKPYAEFVTERMLKPLGMTHTRYDNSDLVIPRRSHGYFYMDNQHVRAKSGGMTVNSDGSLISNLEDMAKWDACLRERKILKPTSYDLIWSPGRLNSGRKRFYGMGWNLTTPGAPSYVGHGGNSVGYSAGFARYTDAGITVIVLANLYPISGEPTARKIAELYDKSLVIKVPSETADPNASRTEKIKAALAALGAGKADDPLLDAELTAPLKTARAGMAPPNSPLKKIDKLAFVNQSPTGQDAWLTYRLGSGERMFTALVLWTHEDKLAQVILRADPPK
jgi:D-alanyl-D-alanine carboxypeptidase